MINVTFIASETTSTTQAILKQKSKIHLKEEERMETPATKKVTRKLKEPEEEREVISLKKVCKIEREESPTGAGPLLRKTEKAQIVGEEMVISKAVTEVKITSSCEVTEDTWSYETATIKERTYEEEGKKTEVYEAKGKAEIVSEVDGSGKGIMVSLNKEHKVDAVAKDEISKEPKKFIKKSGKTTPQAENVQLKPFSKAPVSAEMIPREQTKKPKDIKHPEKSVIPKDTDTQVKGPEQTQKESKEPEHVEKQDVPIKTASTAKTTEDTMKEEEKAPINKRGIIPKEDSKTEKVALKPAEVKKTPSPKVDKPSLPLTITSLKEEKPAISKKIASPPKKMEKEEIFLKPVEPGELKKALSPKADIAKPKPTESIPMERKPSAKLPKKLSPKDSIESVTLKKVQKKISPKEETTTQKTEEVRAVMKEMSPSALLLQKNPTQQEEEVSECEREVEHDDEEETWGWELTPRDSYGSENFDDLLEDGAVETPGMGDKRGISIGISWLLQNISLPIISSQLPFNIFNLK